MFLSKIMIGGAACRNPYEIHRALWNLFPADAEADRDFLFRVGQSSPNKAEVLMQSQRAPVVLSKAAQIMACRKYLPTLQDGQKLRFLLVANPIKTINDEDGRKKTSGEPKKCRVPLIREEDQRSWIERKFQDAALFERLVIDPALPIRFRKAKEERIGKIQPVSYTGILKVIAPEVLITLVQKGIGPAKAFGCGLLSLARA